MAKELIIKYYDPLYNYSIDKYEYEHVTSSDSYEELIDIMTKFYSELSEGSLI